MSKTITAIALVIAFASTADAAPRSRANATCSAIGALYQATVKAKQSGTSKEAMEALSKTVEGDEFKEVIAKVYGGAEFDHVPPQTARQVFQATCKLANS